MRISSIYNSNQILHKVGSRKGKSRLQLETEIAIQKLSSKKKEFKLIKDLLLKSKKLNKWETEFLISLSSFNKLSDKQKEVLNKIKNKIYGKHLHRNEQKKQSNQRINQRVS